MLVLCCRREGNTVALARVGAGTDRAGTGGQAVIVLRAIYQSRLRQRKIIALFDFTAHRLTGADEQIVDRKRAWRIVGDSVARVDLHHVAVAREGCDGAGTVVFTTGTDLKTLCPRRLCDEIKSKDQRQTCADPGTERI